MIILVNGKKQDVQPELTLKAWVDFQERSFSGIAIAVNQVFIPKPKYDTCILKENDQLDLLSPHPGG